MATVIFFKVDVSSATSSSEQRTLESTFSLQRKALKRKLSTKFPAKKSEKPNVWESPKHRTDESGHTLPFSFWKAFFARKFSFFKLQSGSKDGFRLHRKLYTRNKIVTRYISHSLSRAMVVLRNMSQGSCVYSWINEKKQWKLWNNCRTWRKFREERWDFEKNEKILWSCF